MIDSFISARAWIFSIGTGVGLWVGLFMHERLSTFMETLLAGVVIMCFLAIFMEPKK